MAKKIEMLNDQQEVVHPLTSSDCVIMENGKTLEEVMGDGIATPTVTHEGASFQVGVGDSNIEVVDGDVAGMTLEGQTYQNILPKPTTLIMETDEKEFKINDKIDNNIVLDDNVAEIATIKGQTYVNVVQEESASEYVAIDEELNGQSITTTGKPEGYVKNATLEGLTLVNTIQEPSGADATVLELDANIDAQYATIDNTVQGGIHGVALKGQTLVNIHKSATYSLSRQNEGWYENLVAETNRISFEVTDTSTDGWRYLNLGKLNLDMLKPNTKYLVYFGVANFPHNLGVRFMNGNATDKISNEAMVAQGSNWAILTTSSEIIKSEQVLYVSFTNVLGKVEVGNAMIIEYQQGMENWDIPYFEGIKSVEVPSVKTIGKNLIDVKKFNFNDNSDFTLNGNTINCNYTKAESSIRIYFTNLNLRPNTTYRLSATASKNVWIGGKINGDRYAWVDSNNGGITFTPSDISSENYISIKNISDLTPATVSNIQLEEGSTATSYEPYKSSTLTTSKLPLTPDMIEQGSFFDSFDFNTQTYEYIKVPSTNTDFYANRIRSKATFKVHGGDKYIFNFNTNYAITLGFCKNGLYSAKNGSWITNGTTITIPSDCDEMFFAIKKTSGANISPSEFSSVGLEIRHLVNLRKVGDVQDELDLETGKLTQRIGEAVLNGSESGWFKSSSVTGDGGYRYALRLNDGIIKDHAKIMCDKFAQSENAKIGYVNYLAIDNGLKSALYFNSTIETVDEFKQWLSQNPITVQYQLATPIIRQVDLSIVDQDNKTVKTIQAHPTVTHVSTSSQGLIPNVVIPSQLKYPTIIKPSTTYTVQLKQTTVNSDNPLTINLGGTTMAVPSTKFTIATPETLISQDVIFTGRNNVIGEVVITEGDTTGIEYDYFEGMNDVKSPKLFTTGKNLLNVGYGRSAASYGGVTVNFDANAQTFTVNGTSTYDNICFSISKFSKTMLKGKRYALSMHLVSGTPGRISFRANDADWKYSMGNTFIPTDTSKKVILTFEKDVKYIDASIRIDSGATFNNAVFKMMLEEVASGNATSYEPYKGVTIEQSIDSIPLTSSMFEQGGLVSDPLVIGMSLQQVVKGDKNNTTRIRSKSLIPVKPNCKYILNGGLTGWGLSYDKNGGYVATINNIEKFTTTSNAYYITPVLRISDNSNITPSSLDSLNLTLQEVPQEIVLRSIEDIKDTLNLTTGEYVQRIGEVILDGSSDEDWIKEGSLPIFYIQRNEMKRYSRYSSVIKCDKLEAVDNPYLAESSNIYISGYVNPNKYPGENWLYIATDIFSNVDELKTYLQLNPITAQYVLATPIIHKVNLTNTTKLPSYASTTHYDTIVSSNSLVPNIKIPSTIDYNVAIKPSTQYTIRANTTSAMSVNLGGSVGTLANGKVTLTTPSTLAHNSLKLGNGKAKEVMVIEGSEIKDNVPFFNGMKNVQMGGIKLVNIARGATVNGLVTANANKTQFTYTGDGGSWGHIEFDSSLLKPNTVYTLYMNVIKNKGTDSSGSIKYEIGSSNGQDSHNISAGYVGIYKKVITSVNESVMSKNIFKITFRPTASGNQVVIQNPMIFEGDWTHLDEIPYIESEMIIEQPIIRSQGKNLFDDIVTYGAIDGSNGIIGSSSTRHLTVNPLKLLKNVSYTFKINSNNNCMMRELYFYNSQSCNNKTYIGRTGHKETNITYTPNQDCYVRVVILKEANSQEVRVEKGDYTLQIEKSSTATSYEPFKHQTLYSNRVIGYEEGCYYAHGGGAKVPTDTINSMLADVEGLSIAYVNGGSSNYTFWDKDDVFISGKAFLDTSLSSYDKNGFIQVPSNAKYLRFAAGNDKNAQNLYGIATVTGELPLRSLPNGVCDSFNLVTGEYVQRVGEAVLDGSQDLTLPGTPNQVDTLCVLFPNFPKIEDGAVMSDKLIKLTTNYDHTDAECITQNVFGIAIRLLRNKLESADINSVKKFLSQNPVTVQYELATPIVRKIGLTAKGVFAEASLGDCDWVASPTQAYHPFTTRYRTTSAKSLPIVYNTHLFTDDFDVRHFNIEAHGDYEYVSNMEYGQYVNVRRERLESDTLEAFNKWLAQNQIKVGYITWKQTSSSYSNIQKPIFFNNVNVQFMNNNIDIQPSLTLQARTLNSYVMDMMKANTRYTLKALKNANSFTIDGTSYGAGTNGTFTSPSTLTNKLMITGRDVQELMIIEGDVTGLTIPYYKGIRSAYDNVNEIEIYSANKNLLPKEFNNRCFGENIKQIARVCSKMIECKPNATYTVYNIPSDINTDVYVEYTNDYAEFGETVTTSRTTIGSQGKRSKITFTTPIGYKYMAIYIYSGSGFSEDGYNYTNVEIGLCLGTLDDYTYQPHKENSTIINMSTRWETVEVVKPILVDGGLNQEDGSESVSVDNNYKRFDYIPVQPNDWILIYNNSDYRAMNCCLYDINKNFIKYVYTDGTGITIPKNCYFIRGYSSKANTSNLNVKIQRENPTALNKLPNGVKDELIINRATSSAKLIRRVGKIVLDGVKDDYYRKNTNEKGEYVFNVALEGLIKKETSDLESVCIYCDKLPVVGMRDTWNGRRDGIANASNGQYLQINVNKMIKNVNNTLLQDWLKQSPITVYYELAEPVVTEISLKGYPYVYKDGSVQLNTEIPHTTKVKYNVNQEHLINGQNETIIRHDKQIDNLYDYIELYLEEEYRMELFRMQLELSL